MSTSRKNRLSSPPLLQDTKSYDDWLKLVDVWQRVTDLDKQGPAILLSLEGEAQETALQIKTEDLIKDTGVATIIDHLNNLFKKDDIVKKYQALEHFDSYRRPSNVNINQYIVEFEKRLYKTKAQGTKWEGADDILSYRLLKNANLSESKEQLAKATVTGLTFTEVKKKLKSVFGDTANPPPTGDQIKSEQINFAGSVNWQDDQQYDQQYDQPIEEYPSAHDTLFNYRTNRGGHINHFPQTQSPNYYNRNSSGNPRYTQDTRNYNTPRTSPQRSFPSRGHPNTRSTEEHLTPYNVVLHLLGPAETLLTEMAKQADAAYVRALTTGLNNALTHLQVLSAWMPKR